jgi:predicted O-methyltransferase YrrM
MPIAETFRLARFHRYIIRKCVNTDLDEAGRIAERVEGWLTNEEGKLLYELAKSSTGRGAIIEIGSWKGRSTIWLARGSKQGRKTKVYAIDPHRFSSFTDFKSNIKKAGVEDIVIPIVRTSAQAAVEFNMPVELIFIDGSHKFEMVELDFKLWFPKVVENGTMVFHDTTNWPGPKRVVEEHVYRSGDFRHVKFVNSTTFGIKVHKNTLGDRFENNALLCFKKVYEVLEKLYRAF